MLAPHSGQTRLRIAEIKLMLVFLTTANETMMALPFLAAILRRRMHRTLRVGPLARFGGRRGQGLRPLAPDSHLRATASPKADDDNKSCSELGSGQKSRLQRSVGDSTGQSVIVLTLRRRCFGSPPFLSETNTPLRLPLLQRVRSFDGCFLCALSSIFCAFSDLSARFLARTSAHTRSLL
jgi:hypothetical protein